MALSFTYVDGPAVEMITVEADEDYGVTLTGLDGSEVSIPWEMLPAVIAHLDSVLAG